MTGVLPRTGSCAKRRMHLRPIANSTLLVVAAVYGFLLALGEAAGLFGLLLRIFVLLSVWRYGYDILRRFAQGRHEIPAPELETLLPLPDRGTLLHFFLFLSLSALLITTPLLGASLGAELARWLLLVCIAAVFPASAALMSITRNAATALNPVSIAACMQTFGRGYFALLAACLGLLIAYSLFRELIVPVFGWFGRLVYLIVTVWTSFAVFVLIGASIYARREDFAIPGELELETERRARFKRADWKTAVDRAYASLRSGFDVEGHRTIEQLLDSEQRSLEVYGWVLDELWTWENKATVLRFATGYIERLRDAGLVHEALDLFAKCRRASASFSIEPGLANTLADYARSIGRHGIADELQLDRDRE